MSLPGDAFRADCQNWEGYKPCSIQQEQGWADCSNCDVFSRAEVVSHTQSVFISPRTINTAQTVGIVEAGGLGSVLRTTAVSRAIRENNPQAEIYWFTHQRGQDLLRYVPGVTGVLLDAPASPIVASRLDVLVNYESTERAYRVVQAAKSVVGFAVNEAGKFYGVLPAAGHMQRLQIDDDFRKNTNLLNMQKILLRTAGLDEATARYDIELGEDNFLSAENIRRQSFPNAVPNGLIGLVVGTSNKGAVKRWPVAHFAELVDKLSSTCPDKGVLIHRGPDDGEVIDRLQRMLPERSNIGIMPRPVDVGDYLALVKQSELIITGDTFGMHAGFSQSTSTIALASPFPAREIEAGPRDAVIDAGLECAPCYARCSHAVAGYCMKTITVEAVFDQAKAKLGSLYETVDSV